MPIVTLSTDLILPKEFDKKFVEFLGKVLNKPAGNIFVHINDNQRISLGGVLGADSTVIIEIKAIGIFNSTTNVDYSKQINDYLSTELEIAAGRSIIHFVDLNPGFVGKTGTTMEQLLSKK